MVRLSGSVGPCIGKLETTPPGGPVVQGSRHNRARIAMHEYSIVSSLLARVEAEAQARGATAVHRLRLQIGELSGVETSLLESAFEVFRERSICAGATLEIAPVAARWTCPACGASRGPDGPLRCTGCGGPLRLATGDEIVLERIEMEVPDV